VNQSLERVKKPITSPIRHVDRAQAKQPQASSITSALELQSKVGNLVVGEYMSFEDLVAEIERLRRSSGELSIAERDDRVKQLYRALSRKIDSDLRQDLTRPAPLPAPPKGYSTIGPDPDPNQPDYAYIYAQRLEKERQMAIELLQVLRSPPLATTAYAVGRGFWGETHEEAMRRVALMANLEDLAGAAAGVVQGKRAIESVSQAPTGSPTIETVQPRGEVGRGPGTEDNPPPTRRPEQPFIPMVVPGSANYLVPGLGQVKLDINATPELPPAEPIEEWFAPTTTPPAAHPEGFFDLAEPIKGEPSTTAEFSTDPRDLLSMHEQQQYVQFDPKINPNAKLRSAARFIPHPGETRTFNTRTYSYDGEGNLVKASTTNLTLGVRDKVMYAGTPGMKPGEDYGHLLGIDFGTIDAQLGRHGGFRQASYMNRPLGVQPALWYDAERTALDVALQFKRSKQPFEVIAEARGYTKGVPAETRIRVKASAGLVFDSGWIANPIEP
jgi:hypothetical protein